MPTAIYTEPVTDPMAWTGADFASKEDFAFDLSARNVAALESILAADREEGPRRDHARGRASPRSWTMISPGSTRI